MEQEGLAETEQSWVEYGGRDHWNIRILYMRKGVEYGLCQCPAFSGGHML